MNRIKHSILVAVAIGLCASCSPGDSGLADKQAAILTAQDAKSFLQKVEADIEKLGKPASHASWAYATNINYDNAQVDAYLSEQLSVMWAKYAVEAAKFNKVSVDDDTRRQLEL